MTAAMNYARIADVLMIVAAVGMILVAIAWPIGYWLIWRNVWKKPDEDEEPKWATPLRGDIVVLTRRAMQGIVNRQCDPQLVGKLRGLWQRRHTVFCRHDYASAVAYAWYYGIHPLFAVHQEDENWDVCMKCGKSRNRRPSTP